MNQITIFILFGIIQLTIIGISIYFSSYLKKKGENLATKEDIKDITKEVETIKNNIEKDFFIYKNEYNLKIKVYSMLMGFKIEIPQLTQTTYEANILCEYYDARYKFISHNINDLELSKNENNRFLSEIKNLTLARKNFFMLLGEITILFKHNSKIIELVDNLFNFKGAKIVFNETNNNITNLDIWKEGTIEANKKWINDEFSNKIINLLEIMKEEIFTK